jgi:hypothetical protein
MSNKSMVKALEKQVERAKVEFATEFLNRWGMRTPVDTGVLIAGNRVNITDSSFEFDNDVRYFGYVEHGTPNHHPVGMLKTTVAECPEIWKVAMRRAK